MLKDKMKKVISFVLVSALTLTSVPVTSVSAEGDASQKAKGNSASNESNISFNVEWDDSSSYVSGNTFDLDTSSGESKVARMRINYDSKRVRDSGYSAGDLVITVDGLGQVYRDGSPIVAIGADKADEPNKRRDWSYTYNSKTDVYTFTNNKEIAPNSVFSGYFEIVYQLNPRECTDLYERTLTADMLLPDCTLTADPLNFRVDTVNDVYNSHIDVTPLYGTYGFDIPNPEEYFWRRYDLYAGVSYKSRGLIEDATYYVDIPEGAEVMSPFFEMENVGGTRYKTSLETNSESTKDYFYVLYPRSVFAEQDVTVSLEGVGTFHEGLDSTGVEEEVTLTTTSVTSHLPKETDFDFIGGTGDNFFTKHSPFENIEATYGGDILGEKLTQGEELTYVFKGDIMSASEQNPITALVKDDFQYIRLEDGNWRELTSADYNLVSVRIPSNLEVTNGNNFPLTPDVYEYEVRVAQNDEILMDDGGTVVETGVISEAPHMVMLPEGTTAVQVVVKDVKEAVADMEFEVTAKYHIDTSDDLTDINTGIIKNTALNKMFNADGEWIGEGNATEENYEDDTNLHLAQKDLDLYGHYQARTLAGISMYGRNAIKSNFTSLVGLEKFSSTTDEQAFNSNITMKTKFYIDGDSEFKKFSMYTILPDGLNIKGDITDSNLFWDVVDLSGLGLEPEVLAKNTVIDVVPNYRGSNQTYIAFHFDLSNIDVPDYSQDVKITFPVYSDFVWYKRNGGSFTVTSVSLIDDDTEFKDYSKTQDNGSYKGDIWSDIDNDGNTAELLAVSSDFESIIYADSSQFEVGKYVQGKHTNGLVQAPDVASIGKGEDYKYIARFKNGSGIAKDIVIIDNIESSKPDTWHGEFVGVDLSDLQSQGIDATVYYSSRTDIQDVDSADWVTEMEPSQVRSVKLVINGEIKGGKVLDIGIDMKAPTEVDAPDLVTENTYKIWLTLVDGVTGEETPTEAFVSNEVQAVIADGFTNLTIVKEDEINGEKLAGAKFQLIEKDTGIVVAEKETNLKGSANFLNVVKGTEYTIKEIEAPAGYELADPVDIVMDEDEKQITIKDPRKKGSLRIVKQNSLDNSIRVEGAKYSVTNINGDQIGIITTDENGEGVLTDIPWGTYTIKEVESPDGYVLDTTEYKAVINADNCDQEKVAYLEDAQELTTLSLIKYAKTVSGEETNETLRGAVFDLFRDSKFLGSYSTDSNGEIYVTNLPYGNYSFREKRAPEGYKNNGETLDFKITPTDKDISLTAYNQRKSGEIQIYKVDEFDQSVSGGVYELYDASKKPLGQYKTNADGYIYIQDLEWGTYFVKEVDAPIGYLLDTNEYMVEIDANSTTEVIKSLDHTKNGSVILTKYDEAGVTTLSGAVYNLYRKDGSVVAENLETDENGKIQYDNLDWGSYYFKEVKPPVGYNISDEMIRFSVNSLTAGTMQEIKAKDTKGDRVITVTKRIKADDINFMNGNPSFMFCMKGTDVNGKQHEYNRLVTFNEEYVIANTGEDGYATQSVTFSNFLAGEYTVTEEETSRYRFKGISDVENGEVKGDSVVFDMTEKETGCCTYTNETYEAQYLSDATGAANILKESAILTSLNVIWNGADVLDSGTTIDRDLLEVYANYDDGTSYKLANDVYTLSTDVVPEHQGEYIVTVSYTDSMGVTATGNFKFKVNYVLKPIRIDIIVPEDMYPSGFKLCDDCFTYQVVYSNGKKEDLAVSDISNFKLDTDIVPQVNGDVKIGVSGDYEFGGTTYQLTGTATLNAQIPDKYWKLAGDSEGNETGAYLFSDGLMAFYGHVFVEDGFDEDTVPWKVDGFIESIRRVYFAENTSIKHLENCFYGAINLEVVESFPSSVKYMWSTFADCNSLISVPDISDTVQDMNSCFRDCSSLIKAPNVPNSVKYMNDTFDSCTSLVEIQDLPEELEDFENAFYKCSSLVSVPQIPKTKSLDSTFYGCTSLKNVPDIPEGVTVLTDTFRHCEALETAPKIASTVTNMDSTFKYCYKLQEAPELPDGLKNMTSTFELCTSLTVAPHIPDTVNALECAFKDCSSLVEPANFPNNNEYDSIKEMYNRCTSLEYAPDIPEGISWLDWTFSECASLKEVPGLPKNTLLSLVGTFYGCVSLTNTGELPAKTMDMEYTFSMCTGLLSTGNLPDSVWNLGGTFEGCSNLVSVGSDIPIGVTNVNSCFKGCSKLAVAPDISKCSKLSTMLSFMEGTSITTFGDIPESVTNMAYAFNTCNKLTSVGRILSTKLTNMQYTFSLTDLRTPPEIPDSVQNMSGTFKQCYNLETVPVLPSSVDNLEYTFYMCYAIKNAPVIPSKVKSMKDCFRKCTSLEEIGDLPEGVTNIARFASGCSKLEKMGRIPSTVTDMRNAFTYADVLCGDLVIDANPSLYDECFHEASDHASSTLYLTGSSTMLQELANTDVDGFVRVK